MSASENSLLAQMGMKDWTVQVVTTKNGMEAIECGGRLRSYIDPNGSGKLKDRLVEPMLVDDYGVTSINELSEGKLAEYFEKQVFLPMYKLERVGDEWVKIPISESEWAEEGFEEDEEQGDPDHHGEAEDSCENEGHGKDGGIE